MGKGIIYVTTTVLDGLVKIGASGSNNFEERMSKLERDGYRNITGLKRHFAIEVADYVDKEALLHSLFSRSRVSNTELFSLNVNEVVQLLSSFEGKIIYPQQASKNEIFETATEAIQSLSIPEGTYHLDVKPKNGSERVKAQLIVKDGKLTVPKGAVFGTDAKLTVLGWKETRNSIRMNGTTSAQDFPATSPSMAASIVLGHNCNGWKTWKTLNGEYIDIYRQSTASGENE